MSQTSRDQNTAAEWLPAIPIGTERGWVEDQPQRVNMSSRFRLVRRAAAGRDDRAALRARVRIATWLLAALAGAIPLHAANAADRQPNILFILADDLGYGDVGCYNPESKVAHAGILDRLGRRGMRFHRRPQPGHCLHARALQPDDRANGLPRFHAGGTVFTGVGGPSLIAPGRLTLPAMLRAKGYATACVASGTSD